MKKSLYVLLFSVGLFLLGMMLWQQVREQAEPVSQSLNGEELPQGEVLREDVEKEETLTEYKQNTPPVVALTFDDGPSKHWTATLLDGLRQRDVKATFFLIGASVEGNEDLVAQMVEDGHLIGNHTYSHIQLTTVSDEEACAEIDQANAVLSEAVGEGIHYIRPPFGSWQTDLDSLVDMQVVLWTVDPEDWKVQDTAAIVEKVLREVEDGDIILLHDVYKTSVEAAFQIIDALQGKGYEFVRVDEILLD